MKELSQELEQQLKDQTELHEAFNTGSTPGVVCTFIDMDEGGGVSVSFTVHEMNNSKMIHAASDIIMKVMSQGMMSMDEVINEIKENINDRED